jgi:hypothetical protein
MAAAQLNSSWAADLCQLWTLSGPTDLCQSRTLEAAEKLMFCIRARLQSGRKRLRIRWALAPVMLLSRPARSFSAVCSVRGSGFSNPQKHYGYKFRALALVARASNPTLADAKTFTRRAFVISVISVALTTRLSAQARPHRIVSTAPSITEALFALDLGSEVVGVSRFCSFPPEVLKLPKVGTYIRDALGRIIIPPAEIPAGAVLALIGGPYLVWVIRQRVPLEEI